VSRREEIGAIGERVREVFDEKHRAREVTINASRQAIQACASSIRATHRGEYDAAERLAREARGHVATADHALIGHPDVRTNGPLHDAKKELAEAWCTLALVRDDPLPTPEEISVDAAAYCNGLAEAASELRRQLLDRLRAQELVRAEQLMNSMDEIYSLLVTIDYPDGVTGGLRRTTDALRAVLERTRGDLTTSMVAARLQAAIELQTSSAGATRAAGD
jgi:translin